MAVRVCPITIEEAVEDVAARIGGGVPTLNAADLHVILDGGLAYDDGKGKIQLTNDELGEVLTTLVRRGTHRIYLPRGNQVVCIKAVDGVCEDAKGGG